MIALATLALAALAAARAPHVHPLSQFKAPIGERVHASGEFGAVLTASPNVVTGSGGYVTVSWTNYQFPSPTDWIGLFCGADISPYTTGPIKFRWLAGDDLKPPTGSMTFYVMNVRADCRFYLLSGGAQYALIEATSNVVSMPDVNLPSGVRLSLPYSDGGPQMRVSWQTLNAARPVVMYGTTSGALTLTTAAQTSTYTSSDMCGDPARTRGWLAPGSLHTAVITSLTPGQRYYYKVGDASSQNNSVSWSPEASFLAPAVTDVTTILAFGDMGNAPIDGSSQHSWDYGNRGEINSLNITRYLQTQLAKTVDGVVHFGDISYAVGFEAEWDQFHEQIRPIASTVPWMVSIGNHEMGDPTSFIPGTDAGGECGQSYSRRFIMPSPADTQRPDTPWYKFRLGLVTFIMMSTEHDFAPGSPQYAWLTKALTNIDRSVTPWLVFTGHRPMYIDSSWSDGQYSDQGMAQHMRDVLEPMLLNANVDLALWGHHHTFQRTCAVYNGTCGTTGPVHIVVGTAGYELTKNLLPVLPSYFVKALDSYWGFTKMTVTREKMQLDFITVDDGAVQDTITLLPRPRL